MRDEIINELMEAVDEIFLVHQSKLNIISGDVAPLQQYIMDVAIEHLADCMVDILESQPRKD